MLKVVIQMTKNEQINERLEQLLNKAGSTLEGLPKEYSYDQCVSAIHMAFEAFPDAQMESGSYMCRLADIIDRFEVALNNVLVEREALLNEQPTLEGSESNEYKV